MLIDNYNVDYIINIGVAGGVNNNLNVGDIVIGKTLVQHDFDITKFGHEKGFITGVGKEIYSDINLVNLFSSNFDNSNNKLLIGTIASGDIFCTEPSMSLKIHDKFHADGVEMEGAAIAQVCFLCNVPFIIRSISDVVNGSNEVMFDKFLYSSSNVVAKLLVDVINKINR